MQKAHNNINWENKPSDKTPVNEQNLNKMDKSIDTIDDRVIVLDTTKLDKADAQNLVRSITLDRDTGIFTITYFNGSFDIIDTLLEKIAVNFGYDATTQKLSVTLDDGTVNHIDLSALITQYEFLDSDTIVFQVQPDGKIKAIVKEGSIEEKHLRPNYLADIRVEVAKAEASKNAAEESEKKAAASENNAKESEENASASESNAEKHKTDAETAAQNAKASENASKTSETNAALSEAAAKASENAAGLSEQAAADSAADASASAADAGDSAGMAEDFAKMSKSYAIGTDGESRPDDAADNSKFYSDLAKKLTDEAQKLLEQAQKIIAAASTGALIPAGTISFEDLPSEPQVGYMYNISNDFTTDSRFTEGAGIFYRAGANIYWTKDGQWDVMVGTQVTGVKGSSETGYRVGNVNITKANIGLGNVDNTADRTKYVAGVLDSGYAPPSGGTTTKPVYEFDFTSHNIAPVTGNKILYLDGTTIKSQTLSAVTGIKGNSETSYRNGNVNITSADVGAVNKAGDTVTGELKAYGGIALNNSTTESDLQYLLGIDAYAAGGRVHWQSAGDVSVGNAANLNNFKTTFQENVGLDATDTNAVAYVQGNVPIANPGNDGALYRQVFNGSWVHEIFGDYRTGQIAVRGKNNGTWQPWRKILDSENVSNYSLKSYASVHINANSSESVILEPNHIYLYIISSTNKNNGSAYGLRASLIVTTEGNYVNVNLATSTNTGYTVRLYINAINVEVGTMYNAALYVYDIGTTV